MFHKSGSRPDPDAPAPAQLLKALDLHTGEVRWAIPFLGPGDETFAGVMTTAGGLIFFSTREGQFMATDAKTGKMLWHFNTGGTIRASPITYRVGRETVRSYRQQSGGVYVLNQLINNPRAGALGYPAHMRR